jgi:hypothetical protein
LIYIFIAKTHLSSPAIKPSSISLISADFSEIPSTHDSLFNTLSISLQVLPSFFAIKVIIAGSISHDLVHIISHSNGVKPIEVSTTFHQFIAQTEAPFQT